MEAAVFSSGSRKSLPDGDVGVARISSARGPTGAASSAPTAKPVRHLRRKPRFVVADVRVEGVPDPVAAAAATAPLARAVPEVADGGIADAAVSDPDPAAG